MFYLKEKAAPFIGKTVVKTEGEPKKIDIKRLENLPIVDFKTHGKEFFICFPEFSARIHLMLFGYYHVNERKEGGKLRLGMQFEDRQELNFYACETGIIEGRLDEAIDWTTDIMNPSWDGVKALEKVKRKPKQLVCDTLLDQDIFAGVGNKLKDEILFDIRIQPQSVVEKIPEEKLKEMVDIAPKKAFEHLEWEHSERTVGGMNIHYAKTCPRDGTKLHLKTFGKTKRTAYFCEKCQELYA